MSAPESDAPGAGFSQRAEAVCDLAVSLVCGVLVPQRSRVGAVSELVHQFGKCGAGYGCPRRPRAAQVVGVQPVTWPSGRLPPTAAGTLFSAAGDLPGW